VKQQAFDAWHQGRGAITDVFALDMVWRIGGHSLASREYGSKQQLIDKVLEPCGARFAASEPFRPIRIRSVLADGDTVIVRWDGHGIANDGQPYENSHAWFMRLRDGQVLDGAPSTTASPSMTSGLGSGRRADGTVVVPTPTGDLHPVRDAAWSGT
jgi:ketosteroid isomerase-like protein